MNTAEVRHSDGRVQRESEQRAELTAQLDEARRGLEAADAERGRLRRAVADARTAWARSPHVDATRDATRDVTRDVGRDVG
eukprot:gene42834-58931_t